LRDVRRVFGGGKADLLLVDAGDVLESGIDIVGVPRATIADHFTAVRRRANHDRRALLFAIYQVKPSPFCVLDELDAPLDESNINRFVRILQRFSRIRSRSSLLTTNAPSHGACFTE